MFSLSGVARYLFAPLAEAVMFAVISFVRLLLGGRGGHELRGDQAYGQGRYAEALDRRAPLGENVHDVDPGAIAEGTQ